MSGHSPPAGPQWSAGLRPLRLRGLAFDKPLCASLDGFTLHAATRAGGLDAQGREALLRYVLRPPIAQERVEQQPNGLVRITLKKAYREREACPVQCSKVVFGCERQSLPKRLKSAPRGTAPHLNADRESRPAGSLRRLITSASTGPDRVLHLTTQQRKWRTNVEEHEASRN